MERLWKLSLSSHGSFAILFLKRGKTMYRKVVSLFLAALTAVWSCGAALAVQDAGGVSVENGVVTKFSGSGSAVIPDGVSEIGPGAFMNCAGLTGIVIPDSVTKIGKSAFAKCTGLTSVTLPDSVTELGASAFSGCTGLTGVTLSGGLTSLEPGTFFQCSSLTCVIIPEGVTEIGGSAFAGCTALTRVNVPESVSKMFHSAFSDCAHVTIFGAADSYAESFAAGVGIPFAVNGQAAEGGTVYPAAQPVEVDGSVVELPTYTVKDAGGDVNYVRARDVAYMLNGTGAQFNVRWANGAVSLRPGQPYEADGSEMGVFFSEERPYTLPNTVTLVGDTASALESILLTDDQGGGVTCYRLRELGRALGFNVGWSAGRGIFVETGKPYDAGN